MNCLGTCSSSTVLAVLLLSVCSTSESNVDVLGAIGSEHENACWTQHEVLLVQNQTALGAG